MKKALLPPLLTLLAIAGASAAPIWYDVVTNYPLGCITTNSGGVWYPHLPGTITATDALVVSNFYTSGAATTSRRLRVNGLNSEYIMRLFDPVNTNSFTGGAGVVLYASFIANANFVPAGGAGTYFATFNNVLGNPPSATNGFDFRGRVFEIGATNTYPFTNTLAGTYHFCVANAAGDPAQGGGANILHLPIDLIKGVDYQVVLKYDIDNAQAWLWVNPAAETDTANMVGPTADSGAVANGLAGLLFRQRTAGGTVDIRDIAVGTNFLDVVTNVAPGPVLVATNYNTVTNYSGNPALLEVFASSIAGGPLSYQWYQISGGTSNAISGANRQTYVVTSLSAADQGFYFCAITNAGGLGALSRTNFYISVNTASTAPLFTTKPPATTSASIGGTLTLACAAGGTGPLTFQWAYNGSPLTDGLPVTGNAGDLSVVAGSQTPTLSVSSLSTNETGNYTVTVTGSVAPSTNTTSAVTVNPPRLVNIAYLRSLVDHTTWQPTDTASVFAISNCVVTMYTNVTSGTTASYYIQDATAGIDLFVTGDATFRPQLGDLVSAAGTLSAFNNALELAVNSSNPYQFYGITGHTNLLPAPYVFGPLSLTNDANLMETSIEGRLVMLTNVWFAGSLTTSAGVNTTLVVTNSSSPPQSMQIFFPAGTDPDVSGQTIPNRFAWTITGVMAQFKSGAYSPAGYQVYVTRIGDVVTTAPPAVTTTASISGNSVTLSWDAVPYTIDTRGAYSYSVLAATDINGPYLPVATGLTFNTTSGTYTQTIGGSAKFYKVVSP
jgi:hypothetical protein